VGIETWKAQINCANLSRATGCRRAAATAKKYPRWWYDWNLQLTRFSNRIAAYFALMDDRYPSTDDQQALHVDFPTPMPSTL
jgi:hypothetical protein